MKITLHVIVGMLAVLMVSSNPLNIALAQEPGFSCPLPTIPEEVDAGYFLGWDSAPPNNMNQGEHTGISVKGRAVDGQHNLTWMISGTGFSFAENADVQSVETTAAQLILYARGGACGTATIEVVDFAGNTVSAFVRSNSGVWEVCGETQGCKVTLVYSYSQTVHPYRIRWSESKYWNGACYDVEVDCGGFPFTRAPRVWNNNKTKCRCISRVYVDRWVCP